MMAIVGMVAAVVCHGNCDDGSGGDSDSEDGSGGDDNSSDIGDELMIFYISF